MQFCWLIIENYLVLIGWTLIFTPACCVQSADGSNAIVTCIFSSKCTSSMPLIHKSSRVCVGILCYFIMKRNVELRYQFFVCIFIAIWTIDDSWSPSTSPLHANLSPCKKIWSHPSFLLHDRDCLICINIETLMHMHTTLNLQEMPYKGRDF